LISPISFFFYLDTLIV